MAESGSVTFPGPDEPIWQFNWVLADAPDEEGIVISRAFYRGHQVWHKASLPIVRVQYDGPCGPYKDPLHYNNARTTSRCPTTRVCVYTDTRDGVRGITLESYHRIGAYRITNRWTFWEDGQVYPRLGSAGLQCNYDHRHHAYWRIDWDIDGYPDDLALEYNTYTGDLGYGNGYEPIRTETARVKDPSSRRSWAVIDKGTGRGYAILPGPDDGVADSFSTRDIWFLRYRRSENRNGRQGSAHSDGLADYLTGENIDGRDVVIWYAAHLFHAAAGGGDEFHFVGPDLVPIGPWD